MKRSASGKRAAALPVDEDQPATAQPLCDGLAHMLRPSTSVHSVPDAQLLLDADGSHGAVQMPFKQGSGLQSLSLVQAPPAATAGGSNIDTY